MFILVAIFAIVRAADQDHHVAIDTHGMAIDPNGNTLMRKAHAHKSITIDATELQEHPSKGEDERPILKNRDVSQDDEEDDDEDDDAIDGDEDEEAQRALLETRSDTEDDPESKSVLLETQGIARSETRRRVSCAGRRRTSRRRTCSAGDWGEATTCNDSSNSNDRKQCELPDTRRRSTGYCVYCDTTGSR
eukprot:gnl/MRDRNA2_/MRDRNA2_139605_c0_seq1.p1 gnl/MRDRNA2_/MRDRNA2_139605_c0~~gnl/MRDRNA2_/MRDRNA2_139605_c0_seq1.p1  ORF type:complete len:191 (-),score=36.40 gnl/MRDRNA2_/MRDRNA2_139605_c0_seq1:132-704(-)